MGEMDFSMWLIDQLDAHRMSQNDLARRTGISNAQISRIITRQSSPGTDVCNAIARALGHPPETVFRVAGLLPQKSNSNPITDLIMHRVSMLPEHRQRNVLEYIDFISEQDERDGRGTDTSPQIASSES